jgi:hypothetical protein
VLSSFVGEENHVLVGVEEVPHRHVAIVTVPDATITDAQVQPIPNGPTTGLAEGNFTGTSPSRSIAWAANGFTGAAVPGGSIGPRLNDSVGTADRTTNALTLNDSVYFGVGAPTVPGAAVAQGHNNMSPESFFNAMIKY